MEAKKPEKIKEKGIGDESLDGNSSFRWINGFNAAIDAYEEYLGSEGCREMIEKILNQDLPYLENSGDPLDRTHADIMRNNNKTYARAISKALAGKREE